MQEGGMSDKHDVCCEQTLESRIWEKGARKGRVSMLDLVTHARDLVDARKPE
jgi:hypothetical protein